jgi:3'-5' exonuclease
MPGSIFVLDIETVPDLRGFAAANGLFERLDDEVRAEMGDKFPKLIYHSTVCIGALVASDRKKTGVVSAVGAPSIGERSEKEIISAFVNRIADLTPQLVTFNGAAFDLPVLRYRAMVCGVGAASLAARAYFNCYGEDAIDLCDVLSSFSSKTNLRRMSCSTLASAEVLGTRPAR